MKINAKITRNGIEYDAVVFFSAYRDTYGDVDVSFDGAEFEEEPEDGEAEMTDDEEVTLFFWLHTKGYQDAVEIASTNLIDWT